MELLCVNGVRDEDRRVTFSNWIFQWMCPCIKLFICIPNYFTMFLVGILTGALVSMLCVVTSKLSFAILSECLRRQLSLRKSIYGFAFRGVHSKVPCRIIIIYFLYYCLEAFLNIWYVLSCYVYNQIIGIGFWVCVVIVVWVELIKNVACIDVE